MQLVRPSLPLHALVSAGAVCYCAASAIAATVATTVRRRTPDQPSDTGLAYEEVEFPAAGDALTLRGWFIPAPGSTRLVIIVHGKDAHRCNAGIELGALYRALVEQGFNALAFDLRGHGLSDGKRLSLGFYEQRDVLGAISYVKQRGFSAEQIGILSFSMGAATTLLVLPQTDIRAVVADSAYADLHTLLRDTFAHRRVFLPGVLAIAYLAFGIDVRQVCPAQALRSVTGRRILLVHGGRDRVVPPDNLWALAAAGGRNIVDAWMVPEAEHIRAIARHSQTYFTRVIDFFNAELVC